MNRTFFCWNEMNEYRRKIRAFLGWRNEINGTFFCWNEMNEYWRKIRSFVRILLLIFIHKRRKIRAFVGWRDEMNGTFFCWNGMNEYRRKIRAFLGRRNDMNEYHFLEWDETIFYISLKKFIFSFP